MLPVLEKVEARHIEPSFVTNCAAERSVHEGQDKAIWKLLKESIQMSLQNFGQIFRSVRMFERYQQRDSPIGNKLSDSLA